MKDVTIARLAQEWSILYDEMGAAERKVSEARDRLSKAEESLESTRRRLIDATRVVAARSHNSPVTVRTWQHHTVIIDVNSGSVRCGVSVERE